MRVLDRQQLAERENVWGAGPELTVSIGSKRVHFFVNGRILFARDANTAVLTNAGVSLGL